MLWASLDHQLFCIHGFKLLLRNTVPLFQEWLFIALHMQLRAVFIHLHKLFNHFLLQLSSYSIIKTILTVSHTKKYLLMNILLLIFGLKNIHNHKRAKVIFQSMCVFVCHVNYHISCYVKLIILEFLLIAIQQLFWNNKFLK